MFSGSGIAQSLQAENRASESTTPAPRGLTLHSEKQTELIREPRPRGQGGVRLPVYGYTGSGVVPYRQPFLR